MPEFVKVAEVSALEPETSIPLTVGDKDIALVFTGGQIFALDGICPHSHCFIAYGWVDGNDIICGCHGASFDVRTGEPQDFMSPRSIATFPVQVDGNDILVALP